MGGVTPPRLRSLIIMNRIPFQITFKVKMQIKGRNKDKRICQFLLFHFIHSSKELDNESTEW